ncbi:MAG: delta-60 repeat domain-containing protein [Flavobacteriales bacterium]|nr:delta-60 repeat domain-containing protein [Flavobacteriales bacterium]
MAAISVPSGSVVQHGLSTRYVVDLMPLADGKVLISGPITYPGENINQPRYGARLNADGTRDLTFNSYPGMGGRMVSWEDHFYCGAGQTVRRLQMDGTLDQGFIPLNSGPYLSLQGGDYHVYPDGRVLMSGAHVLEDSIRAFEGLYSLIWFSNEGYLDTTRTHRLCNGVIYAIEEQPDGKFLCTGTMTTYEGQPVSRVFRVEADGTLDPNFSAEVQPMGEARDYFTLSDGRILLGGTLRLYGIRSSAKPDPP